VHTSNQLNQIKLGFTNMWSKPDYIYGLFSPAHTKQNKNVEQYRIREGTAHRSWHL